MKGFDAHIHIILDGTDFKSAFAPHLNGPDESIVRKKLAAYRDAGFTYLRDGGDRYGVSLLAKELAPEYGITFRSPAFAIHREGCYGRMLGYSYSDYKSYKELLKKARSEGADFIKLMLTGIMDFSRYEVVSDTEITKMEIDYVVKLAKDAGFSVMAHCNSLNACSYAIEAGVDSIEHGFYMGDNGIINMAMNNNCIWVPTLSAVACLSSIENDRIKKDVIAKILSEHGDTVSMAFGMDLPVAIGTDAGSYLNPHVTSATSEVELIKTAVFNVKGYSTGVDEWLDKGCKMLMDRF